MSKKPIDSNDKGIDKGNTPRVPAVVDNPLGGESIQVNFCKNPACANFGAPAVTSHVKPGPSQERDDRYKLDSTGDGLLPALRCKSCAEKVVVKSNVGVVEEIQRLTRNVTKGCGCPNSDCSAHGLDVMEHPYLYQRNGRTSAGTGRYICKTCRAKFSYGRRRKFLDADKTERLFKIIMNKAPMRRSLELLDWESNQAQSYYLRLDLLSEKSRFFSAVFDRQLARSEFDLGSLCISTDMQQYTVNWDDSDERENTLINAVFSVDNNSGFIFCAHPAFDADINAKKADSDFFASGDHKLPEAYRKYARLWMPGDELRSHRKGKRKVIRGTRSDLASMIEDKYAAVMSVPDTEDTEESSKPAQDGKMVHYPYTAYASMFILERLTKGARHVVHCLDRDSVSRAACLAAFENRIRKGSAHAFFVSVNKNYTIDERKAIRKKAESEFRVINRKIFNGGATTEEVIELCMKQNIQEARKIGPWQDEWVKHPLPRMDEPEKALCWLTGIGPSLSDDTVKMFVDVSMNGVDNTLQLVRRRISMLERPIKTASAKHSNWNGYSFYKPRNIEKSLNLFRCYMNFCVKRDKDRTTAAMRLGIANKPYTISDIVNLDSDNHPVTDEGRFRILHSLPAA